MAEANSFQHAVHPQLSGPLGHLDSDLFRALTENIREVFWVADPLKHGVLYASPAFEQVWGVPVTHAYEDQWFFLKHTAEEDLPRMRALAGTAEPWQAEHRITRGDGDLRWVSTRGVPLRNSEGAIHLVVGVTEDITERRHAQMALQQTASFMRTLLDSIPDMLFLVRRDLSFVDYRGPQDHLLRSTTNFDHKRITDIFPAHLAEESARCVAVALDRNEVSVFEYALDLPDGTRHFEARFAPCEPADVLMIVRDVSERKRTDQALRQSELRFRTLAETSFEGVALFQNGRIRAANQTFAKLFNCELHALLGTRALRLVMPKWRRFVCERQQQDLPFEMLAMRPDGSTFYAEYQSKGIPNEAPTRRVGTVRDISERRKHEQMRRRFIEQIISAQEDERRRIARELHDTMAQSLTSLSVGLRALSNMVQQPDVLALLHNLRQLTVGTIADAQRLARGLRPSVLDDLGFKPAVERLVSDMARGQTFHLDLHMSGFNTHARLPPVMETALYRILQEALTNVARHASATAVDILVERHAAHVRVVVEDNGRGFAPAVTTHAPSGGLGLLGMYERAALLHGQATVDSSPGLGTTLSVHLPLIKDPEEAAPRS